MERTSPTLPFPGRLLHRKVLKHGTVIEVRIRHMLMPTMPQYWDKVNDLCREIGGNMALPGYQVDVMALAKQSRRVSYDLESVRKKIIEGVGIPGHLISDGRRL